MPRNYTLSQRSIINSCKLQGIPRTPLESVSIAITLKGKHSRKGDTDNVAGAIMDALVKCNVLRADNMKAVPSLVISLDYCPKTKPTAEVLIANFVS